MSAAENASACAHCGLPVEAAGERFCCAGCANVFALLHAEGLGRYYELRRGVGQPQNEARGFAPGPWLEQLESELECALSERPEQTFRTELDIDGLHCGACVWLIEKTFARHAERAGTPSRIIVNPALARASLELSPGFPLRPWLAELSRFGYRSGPASDDAQRSTSSGLLIRTALCLALAGNLMLFSLAQYAGLRGGELERQVHVVTFVGATLSVLIGGSVFLRSAWASLRARVLHFDVPIALGIALAYVGAALRFALGDGQTPYLDTVAVFIAFMVLGRYLQERALERSRRRLLSDDSHRSLLTRRLASDTQREELVACATLEAGDTIVLRRGDLVPVAARALHFAACSLDWIEGESEPRRFEEGDVIPAGAFYMGASPARAIATERFADSAVLRLLTRDRQTSPRADAFWGLLARSYVLGVLGVAVLGFGLTFLRGGDVMEALAVATSVLVVTCPCAFGIAVPLAHELAHAQLRRHGVFLRKPGVLDRLLRIERVVFDKTGTLTTGALRVQAVDGTAAAKLDAHLDRAAESALHALVGAQDHPKSVALRSALRTCLYDADVAARVVEAPGRGVEVLHHDARYRLGAPAWACTESVPNEVDLVFARDGRPLLTLTTQETVRPRSRELIEALRQEGITPYILSGDRQARVDAVAAVVGLEAGHAHTGVAQPVPAGCAVGDASPDEKAAFIRALSGEGTLMVGDGLNDALALDLADVSATPASERPFVASRCDFYLTSAGLGGIRDALSVAKHLRHVVRVDLAIAVLYNVGAVSIALSGAMRPWLAAILMPASSLLTVAYTVHAMTRARQADAGTALTTGRLAWK
ncbi:MAG: heavy metal translocating P-type ATPase metal-binding domain-containing protein [Myxococcales bacterium]|nr:heavy metal translocating P-type ATPase metal-binding domain-containing protein [Myxococcales bacterium]MCB9629369.1 heavy metal translocating P-type ATPase metal-binding domain-containing protein [Sandaracinaceae bacterium]